MRNAVYIAIVLWFLRRIFRKETPAAPVKAPESYADPMQRVTPGEVERMLLDGLQQEMPDEIDRIIAAKLPSWKEFV